MDVGKNLTFMAQQLPQGFENPKIDRCQVNSSRCTIIHVHTSKVFGTHNIYSDLQHFTNSTNFDLV